MQIVLGDNLHESQYLFSGKNKKNSTNFSSAELAKTGVNVKQVYRKRVFLKLQMSINDVIL